MTQTAAAGLFLELRDAIVSGRLAAGSQHSIYRLADEWGMSRTPVREAVLRLADLGLVAVEKNRGVRIIGVQASDVWAVFEVRVLLEIPAARRAARERTSEHVEELNVCLSQMREAAQRKDQETFSRSDRQLHAVVAKASGNQRLADEVHRLRESIQARGVTTFEKSRTLADVICEHEPIVDAITAHDEEGAARAMFDHLAQTAALLVSQLSPDAAPDDLRSRMAQLVGL